MTVDGRGKKQARALQVKTGWKYTECLRVVTTMTPEAIEALIKIRATKEPADE